jgi:hypothetical protein
MVLPFDMDGHGRDTDGHGPPGAVGRTLCAAALVAAISAAPALAGALALERSIPLDSISGRFDHFAYDSARRMIFLAATNAGELLKISLDSGRIVDRVGLPEGHGVLHLPDLHAVAATSEGDGAIEIFNDSSLETIANIDHIDDVDNIRRDPRSGSVLVGCGHGALVVIDPIAWKLRRQFLLPAHPEAFEVDPPTGNVLINVPEINAIIALDQGDGSGPRWALHREASNFPMALDARGRRLYVATRRPPRLVVFDADSASRIGSANIGGDADDLWFDARRRRVYVSCGEGLISIVDVRDPSAPRVVGHAQTSEGARTSIWIPSLDRLLVAAPASGAHQSRILVFRPTDE